MHQRRARLLRARRVFRFRRWPRSCATRRVHSAQVFRRFRLPSEQVHPGRQRLAIPSEPRQSATQRPQQRQTCEPACAAASDSRAPGPLGTDSTARVDGAAALLYSAQSWQRALAFFCCGIDSRRKAARERLSLMSAVRPASLSLSPTRGAAFSRQRVAGAWCPCWAFLLNFCSAWARCGVRAAAHPDEGSSGGDVEAMRRTDRSAWGDGSTGGERWRAPPRAFRSHPRRWLSISCLALAWCASSADGFRFYFFASPGGGRGGGKDAAGAAGMRRGF